MLTKKVPAFVTDVVEYQRNVKRGLSIEIDLLGIDGNEYVLVAECKFKSEKFGKEDLENFLKKLNYVPAQNLKIMLFSLSGFTDYVATRGKEFTLIDINKMY